MREGSTIATERRPETKTAPGLTAFLTRQREAALAAASSDTQSLDTTGQSEPGSSADTSSDSAKADPVIPEGAKTDKKQKTAEELKAELSNQAKASLRLGAEKAELQRKLDAQAAELAEWKGKADGTFVEPSKHQKDREAALKAEFAKFEQRRESSKTDAIKEFGEEYVLTQIYQDEAPFATLSKERPWLVQRVMSADRPVHEALAVVNEEAVLTKFGRTEAEVLTRAEAILKPKLFEQFKTELVQHDGGAKTSPTVPSLNKARAAGTDPKLGGAESMRTFSALTLNPHNRM